MIAALDDDTPTRETFRPDMGTSSMYMPPQNIRVVRRSDLALQCIEQIASLTFFRRTQWPALFSVDTRRAAMIANARAWWKLAKGKSRADGIRIEFALFKNSARPSDGGLPGDQFAFQGHEAFMLFDLAALDGPTAVLERLRELADADSDPLNGGIRPSMMRTDPQYVLRSAMARLEANHLRDADCAILLPYGNKAVYQELARRSGDTIDPIWESGDVMRTAAEYGKAWALSDLAAKRPDDDLHVGGRRGLLPDSQPWRSDVAAAHREGAAKPGGYPCVQAFY